MSLKAKRVQKGPFLFISILNKRTNRNFQVKNLLKGRNVNLLIFREVKNSVTPSQLNL